MTSSLKGKRALVTGGSRGIGAGIVKRLAREGANVALTYVSKPDQAEATAAEAQGHGVEALVIQADAADPEAVTAAVDQAAEAWGGLDILVNNAGIAPMGMIDNFKLEKFDRVVAVNLRAVFVGTQAAVKHMGRGGRIITIGSCNAERVPFPGGAVYAMSKAGVAGLVRGLARDLGPRGITVNNVQPGPVDTDMNPADGPFAEMMQKQMAVGRHGTVEEVAAFVAFLVSDEAAYITGASLMADGGFSV